MARAYSRFGLGLALVFVLVCGCVSGADLELPPAPSGSQTLLFVENCRGTYRARVADAGQTGSLFAEVCPVVSEWYVAYYPKPAALLGWTQGPLAFEPCSVPGECCIEAALPFPLESTAAFSASGRIEGGRDVWTALESWPPEIAALRFPRRCYCPRAGRRTVVDIGAGRGAQIAVVDGEELLVAVSLGRGDAREVHVYETNLAQLLTGVLPDEPTYRAVGLFAADLGVDGLGNFFVSNDEGPELALGRLGGELQIIPGAGPDFIPESVALRPGLRSGFELSAISEHHPSRIYTLTSTSWRRVNRASEMRGRCDGAPSRLQRSYAEWLSSDELILMPAEHDCSFGPRVCTSTTAPDGFWQIRGGVTRWNLVERRDPHCLSRLAYSPDYGVLAITRRPGILYRDNGVWRDLLEGEGFGSPELDLELRGILAIAGGLMFTRQGGVLGSIVDGHICEETPIGLTTGLRGLVRVGYYLVLESRDGEADPGAPAIHVVEMDWTDHDKRPR